LPRKSKANPNGIYLSYPDFQNEECASIDMKPVKCEKCGAYLAQGYTQVGIMKWKCYFCRSEFPKNPDVVKINTIKDRTVCYKLVPEAKDLEYEASKPDYLFIIDISGSMSENMKELDDKSPIQMLSESIIKKLKELKDTTPESKVGLIFFNDNVFIVGDSSKDRTMIESGELLDSEDIIKQVAAASRKELFIKPIKESCDKLIEAVNEYTKIAQNWTALGPAIVAGIEFLKNSCFGSNIFIYTDGESNCGLGRLDANKDIARGLFKKWAKEAREAGITINFTSLTTCKFDSGLYDVFAHITGGQIQLYVPKQPDDISKFKKIEPIGFNATATIILPKFLKFWRILESDAIQGHPSKFIKKYGILDKTHYEYLNLALNLDEIADDKAHLNGKFVYKDLFMPGFDFPVQIILEWTFKQQKFLKVATKKFAIISSKLNKLDIKAGAAALRNEVIAAEIYNPQNAPDSLSNLLQVVHDAGDKSEQTEALLHAIQGAAEEYKIIAKSAPASISYWFN